MSDVLHAPVLNSISSHPCECGAVKPFGERFCKKCELDDAKRILGMTTKVDLGKPWDENSFGVLAEKVLCDGCGEEIDPRQTNDLCKSCTEETFDAEG